MTTTNFSEFHVADVGVALRATIKDEETDVVPLQSASVKQYTIRKPSGAEITVDCDFVTDGSDGLIQYVTVASTFDEAGYYKLQGYLEMGTSKWHTNTITFRVYPNI